jgi:hypothetical protein
MSYVTVTADTPLTPSVSLIIATGPSFAQPSSPFLTRPPSYPPNACSIILSLQECRHSQKSAALGSRSAFSDSGIGLFLSFATLSLWASLIARMVSASHCAFKVLSCARLIKQGTPFARSWTQSAPLLCTHSCEGPHLDNGTTNHGKLWPGTCESSQKITGHGDKAVATTSSGKKPGFKTRVINVRKSIKSICLPGEGSYNTATLYVYIIRRIRYGHLHCV